MLCHPVFQHKNEDNHESSNEIEVKLFEDIVGEQQCSKKKIPLHNLVSLDLSSLQVARAELS